MLDLVFWFGRIFEVFVEELSLKSRIYFFKNQTLFSIFKKLLRGCGLEIQQKTKPLIALR